MPSAQPKTTVLTADRAGRREHTPEAEPVVVEVDGERAVLTLDDGETIAFVASELRQSLGAAA